MSPTGRISLPGGTRHRCPPGVVGVVPGRAPEVRRDQVWDAIIGGSAEGHVEKLRPLRGRDLEAPDRIPVVHPAPVVYEGVRIVGPVRRIAHRADAHEVDPAERVDIGACCV